MSYTFVGLSTRTLTSGRPISFGSVLQDSDLPLADDETKAQLVPPVQTEPVEAPAPAEAPAPPEAPAPDDAQEVVNTGNPSQSISN